jgi:hypothetical protein
VAAGVTYRTARMTQLPWASSIRDYNALLTRLLGHDQCPATASRRRDMGRSTPGEEAFRFKQQWGRISAQCDRLLDESELPNVSPANPKFHLAIAMWQKLPVALTLRVGPMIVRAIP